MANKLFGLSKFKSKPSTLPLQVQERVLLVALFLQLCSLTSQFPLLKHIHLKSTTMATATKITTTIATIFLIISLFVILIPSTDAQKSPPAPAAPAPSPGVNCFSVLVNMSDCLTFVEKDSNLTKPDKGCCPEIAGLLDSNPICLCQMLGRAHSGAKIGFNIDIDKALKLPSVCGLEIPPATTCSGTHFLLPLSPFVPLSVSHFQFGLEKFGIYF